MIKLILSLIFCSVVTGGFAQTFYSGNNQVAITTAANDNFSYLGKTVAHYGMGWYNEQENVPASAYISGFGGIRLFTWGQSRVLVNGIGNVGIGTESPDQKLTIKGGGIGFDNNSADKKLYSPLDGDLEWMTHDAAGSHGFAVSHQGERRIYLSIHGNSYLNGGNVGIGTTNPQDKLTVAGNIGAREIKVSTTAGADFVFEPDYKLPDLTELEKFVKTNKHLPEIPTAKQMVENGINLGELNVKLLQKVEELTLHLIAKDKQMNTLQAVVDEQAKILREIQKKLK